MLYSIGQDAKGECLNFSYSLLKGVSISQNPGDLQYLCQPPAIYFLFVFDGKGHRCQPVKKVFILKPQITSFIIITRLPGMPT